MRRMWKVESRKWKVESVGKNFMKRAAEFETGFKF
jgi:hypothetical protein